MNPHVKCWNLLCIKGCFSSFCPVSKLKQRRHLSPGLLLTGLCQVWFRLKKSPESILCFLCGCRDRLLLVSEAVLEKCVSGTAPLAAPLSWLAGAVASHRKSYSPKRPMAGQESGAGSLKVAKTTTFEWVCSWNAARQRYITEREVRAGERGRQHVERLFPVALNLFISSVFHLPSGILANRSTP